MALADIAANPPTPKPRCSFYDWKQTLPESELEAVLTMMADRRWTAEALAFEFQQHGATISETRVRDHRKGLCRSCSQ